MQVWSGDGAAKQGRDFSSRRSAWCRTPPPRPDSGDRDSSPSEPGTGALLSPPPTQQFDSLTLGILRRLELWWRRRKALRSATVEHPRTGSTSAETGSRYRALAALRPPTDSEFFPWFSHCSPMASGERGARVVTREGCRGHRGSGARGAAARMELRTAACRPRERRGRLPYEEEFRTRTCTGAAFVTLCRGGTCCRAQGNQTKTVN